MDWDSARHPGDVNEKTAQRRPGVLVAVVAVYVDILQ